MSRFAKALLIGSTIGSVGILISIVPFGTSLEEAYGLHLLFILRGTRQVPTEVVIISLDKSSAEHLDISDSPRKWPRSLHAHLIEKLVQRKAAIIAFDIIFNEERVKEEDKIFAAAIEKAGNVVLADWLKKDKVPVFDSKGIHSGNLEIERILPPIAALENAALASAPFALPKVPVKVNRYWAFKTSAGDTPTLPVVVFQIFALQVYDQFIKLLNQAGATAELPLSAHKEDMLAHKSIKESIYLLKYYLELNPAIAAKMRAKLEASRAGAPDEKEYQILQSLRELYQGPQSRYLNFYGPPGTIPTISYYRVLEEVIDSSADADLIPLNGKVIFVGLSERLQPGQKDGFYTVFSQPDGLDISGVEIAATAFANILEDKPIRPLKAGLALMLLFSWGMLISVVCIFFPTTVAAAIMVSASGIYLFIALYSFRHTGLWIPVVIPLFFQMPVAFFGTLLWKFFEANRERRNIRTAFGYYLPNHVVDQLAKSISNVTQNTQLVYGTCLLTDAEQYTALSEVMEPEELTRFINKYYEVIFEPVRKHSGIISDVKGDSMLAIWAATRPDKSTRRSACQAALEILQGVNAFNHTHKNLQLPTRIGVHSGHFSLGSVTGARPHVRRERDAPGGRASRPEHGIPLGGDSQGPRARPAEHPHP